jgi:excisionase family DNA binding protein
MPKQNVSQKDERREHTFVSREPISISELLTVREVAKRLRVDDTTVRRWIKNGVLEAIALPHRGKRQAYRIKSDTLSTLLSEEATTD